MTLINAPLSRSDQSGPRPGGHTIRAMQVGQHVIAVVLTAIGVIRAISDGTPSSVAIVTGIAVLAWHTTGALLPAGRASSLFVTGWLIGFAAVWIAAVIVSAEFVWLAFLLWLLAGHLLPVSWGLLFSAFVLSVVVVAPILIHDTTSYASVFGPLVGGVFAFGISRGYLQLLNDAAERERLVTSLKQAQQETAALQDELAIAQREAGAVAERTRIARDIHDTVAQDLSSIRLLAHAGSRNSEDPKAAITLAQVETVASDSLADVRRIVDALVPAELQDNALAAALRRMFDRAHEETGIEVELNVDNSLPLLPTEVEVALLRTAQSALANVRLHAHASRVAMHLIDAGRTVRLDIVDDGVGFDVTKFERVTHVDSSSYGLRFTRARLRELGGDLDIEASPGAGTAVIVQLPMYPETASTNTKKAQ